MTSIPGEVKCDQCGYFGPIEYYREFHLETPILACPKCKEAVEIVKGRECSIISMNLEIEDGIEAGGENETEDRAGEE